MRKGHVVLHIVVVVALVAFACASVLATTAEYAQPQIVRKPLLVTPGQPVQVDIYNGGEGVWSDLTLSVQDTATGTLNEVLEPEKTLSLAVEVPLRVLLSATNLSLELKDQGRTLDRVTLPVVVQWPRRQAVLEPQATGETKIYIFIDNSAEKLIASEVEVSIFKGNRLIYIDLYGPFHIGPGEEFWWSTTLPRGRLPKDANLKIKSTFLEDEKLSVTTTNAQQAETRTSGPIISAIAIIIGLGACYLILSMIFHGHTLRGALRSLKK